MTDKPTPTTDLLKWGVEIHEGRSAGVLSGEALRDYAKRKWPGRRDTLQMAEHETGTEALALLAKWGGRQGAGGETTGATDMTTQQTDALQCAADLEYSIARHGMQDAFTLNAYRAMQMVRTQQARITELESQLAQRFDAADVATAAQAVVDRWDTPLWKDVPATAEYIGRLRAALAAGQATAAQGGAYAALPEPYCNAHDDADAFYPDMFSEHQMRAFADATYALRASHGQAPAGAGMGHTDGGRNMFYEGRFDGESQREQQARLRWANDMRAAFERHTGNGWFDKDWRTETGLWSSAWHACLAAQPSPTAQSADSVPAVSDLPPLPAPDLRDVGTKPQEIKEFLKGYATEYARTAIAARAPADSVLEDAARYRFLRDGEWRDTDLEPFIRLQLNTLWDAKIDAARAAQEGGK